MKHIGVIFAVLLACVAISSSAATTPITISTAQGSITGYQTNSHKIFKGVPFAKPPVGNLRLRPPVSPAVRSKVLITNQTAPACYVQEDCLYLDIYVPVGVTSNAAVMIWIHGGSYISGGSSAYPGISLTNNTNTILVPINYRLGVFGFLALNELLARDNTTGNYGMQDQRFAIQWVKNNIANFGGSPSKITIAGESAGAFSICSQLQAPKSQGLFRAAIFESSYIDCNLRDLSGAVSDGNRYANSFQCTGSGAALLACVMSADASAIYASFANDGMTAIWRPCADGYEYTATNGLNNINALPLVPLLIGTNAGENVGGTTFGCTAQRVADSLSSKVSVYVYYFAQGPSHHADELPYFYHPTSLTTAPQLKLSKQMINYWISFVQNMVPTSSAPGSISWPKYSPNKEYIVLNSTLYVGTNFGSGQNWCPYPY